MLTVDRLFPLAEKSGFAAKITKSLAQSGEQFSICIAAPSYDQEDRFRPFNLKRDPAAGAIKYNSALLLNAARSLDANGLMFVYGLSAHLAHYATALSKELAFRYWIAIRTVTEQKRDSLRPEHTALLLMSRPGATINKIRIPHQRCRYCDETLKDWGGKSHLMHAEGVALSDVWMDMVVDPVERLPLEMIDRILRLSQSDRRDKALFLLPDHQPSFERLLSSDRLSIQSFNPLSWKKSESAIQKRSVPEAMLDRLQRAKCLDALKAVPSETIDLAFADPPFNLTKTYNGYSDDLRDSDYIGWCKRWLVEYERVLKPGGSMFLLNLPRWSVWLLDFLTRSRSLYLQNWIVWNSLPEPKGVVMPAHYSLLYLTKGEQAARFNYCSMENGWEPFDEAVFPPDRSDVCRRRSCVRRRRASANLWRGELTDIWHDIHRQRLASRWPEASKAHPCQTPERLIDRIVRLATNPGDIVLDAFAGIGTTAMIASRLGRRFIAIEQDDSYIKGAESRIEKLKSPTVYIRNTPKRRGVSKRALQIELRRLAVMLGRLPTRADAEQQSKFSLDLFDAAFDSWSAALKAAKITISSVIESSIENNALWPLKLDSESTGEADSRIN